MRNKIPPEAFDHYVSLGTGRSYAAVATRYGVSLRGITKRAIRESWQARLAQVEADARRKQDERAVEDLGAVNDRHLKTARAVLARGLEALRTLPLTNAAAAVRAIESAVRMERLVLGTDKRDEAKGMTWAQLVDGINRAAEARPIAEHLAPPAEPDPVPGGPVLATGRWSAN